MIAALLFSGPGLGQGGLHPRRKWSIYPLDRSLPAFTAPVVLARQRHTAAIKSETRVTTPDQFKTEMIGLLPRLRRFAMTLARSASDADDLVQEGCAAALQKWHLYDPAQPLEGIFVGVSAGGVSSCSSVIPRVL